MVEEKSKRRKVYRINVGPLFKDVIEKQRKNIMDVTLGVCDSSEWEASEMLAKKIKENRLV